MRVETCFMAGGREPPHFYEIALAHGARDRQPSSVDAGVVMLALEHSPKSARNHRPSECAGRPDTDAWSVLQTLTTIDNPLRGSSVS